MAAYTPEQVQRLFVWYGIDASAGISVGLSPQARIQHIVNDLNSGTRTWSQVVASVSILPGANHNPAAPDPGPDPNASPIPPVAPYSGTPANTWPGATPTSDKPDDKSGQTALDKMFDTFPWLRQLGISATQLQDWAVRGLSGEALYNEITQTPQYKAMFPAIRRDDGTLRMSEAQYLSQEDQYRVLLKQYGINNPGAHSDLSVFFSQEIDPNELKQRLDVYDNVKRGAQDIKDAFYVYAGLTPSTDDLYQAVVDPDVRAQLTQQYVQATTVNTPDYPTFITRATEVGLRRVANLVSPPTSAFMQDMTSSGIDTSNFDYVPMGSSTSIGAAAFKSWAGQPGSNQKMQTPIQVQLSGLASKVQQTNPDTARQVVDLLYHGGDPSGQTGKFLSLQELLHAFEFAMIGSAATENGLQLPSLERIQALRDAGVTRAAALSAYSDFSGAQGLLSGEATRAGYKGFGQNEFEQAILLHQGTAAAQLSSMQAQEKALTHASGASTITEDQQSGRTLQSGLRGQYY